jgi:hypothetical protein
MELTECPRSATDRWHLVLAGLRSVCLSTGVGPQWVECVDKVEARLHAEAEQARVERDRLGVDIGVQPRSDLDAAFKAARATLAAHKVRARWR